MSDSSQGEGWWQASDGKWYPPHLHPSTPWFSVPPQVPIPVEPDSKPWWRQWWVPVLGVVILLGVVGAFVGEDEAEQVNEPSSPPANLSELEETEPDPDPVNLSEPEEPEPDPATPLGTLENPYPIGQAGTFAVRAFGDANHSVWSIVVDGPGTDITESIASENMFNPSPDEGSLQFGVPVSLTLIEAGKEPLDTFWNINFGVVGKASLSLSDMGFFGCGVVPQGFDQNQQVFIGGTISGVMCFEVSEKDYEAGVMLTVDERNRVFLDAGPDQNRSSDQDAVDPSSSEAVAEDSEESSSTTVLAAPPEDRSGDSAESSAESTGTTFSYESGISGYVWDGEIAGYTFESANSLADDDVQRCIVAVGTISPSVVEDHGLTSGLSNPEFSLIVDGRLVESELFGCDTDQATDAGYRSPLFEQMTAGSEFPFFVSFELPAELSEPDAVEIIVGDTDGDRYQRIQVEQLDVLPPGTFVGMPLPADTVQPAGTVVQHYDSDGDWEVLIDGVVVLDAVGRSDGGSCVIVLGTMTPTDTGDALVADGSDAPSVSIVVGGLSRSSDFAGCQDDVAEKAGYEDPDYADVTAGTTYHFYDATYLAATVNPAIEAVSIGLAGFDDVNLVQAPVLDSIPSVGG